MRDFHSQSSFPTFSRLVFYKDPCGFVLSDKKNIEQLLNRARKRREKKREN